MNLRPFARRAHCFYHTTAAALILLAGFSPPTSRADEPPPPAAASSDAQKIADLQQVLTADQARQSKLHDTLSELEREFQTASKTFGDLDAKYLEKQAHLKKLAAGDERDGRQQELEKLKTEWQHSRDEFDRIIKQRKVVQKQVDTLSEKISVEKSRLQQLTSPKPTGPKTASAAPTAEATAPNDATTPTAAITTPSTTGTTPTADPKADVPSASDANTKSNQSQDKTSEYTPNTTEPAQPAPQPDATQTKTITPQSSPAAPPATPAAKRPSWLKQDTDRILFDAQVAQAAKHFENEQRAVQAAQARVDHLSHTISVFEQDLASSREFLKTLQQQAADVQKSIASIEPRLREELSDEDRQELRAKLEKLRTRDPQIQQEIDDQTNYIKRSAETLDHLRQSAGRANQALNDAREAVARAKSNLEYLESPLAPRQLRNLLIAKGPKVLLVVLGLFLFWWLARLAGRKLIGGLIRHSRRGNEVEKQNRADTLRRVFTNGLNITLATVGTLAVLDQIGINVTVLLGGAAVLGAAIAFGAQNLIRDYVAGFMILLENQYSIGNVVEIRGVSGVVEDISLRITALRDEEGIIHFIPHSQIDRVSNMTYGWSRAVFTVKVGLEEDVDQVMTVLLDLARELRDDPIFGPQMLGQPEMLGVDQISDIAVAIKLLVKTRPLKQWDVKRELLRRIKKRFDELGISPPVPRQVVIEKHPRTDGAPRRQATVS